MKVAAYLLAAALAVGLVVATGLGWLNGNPSSLAAAPAFSARTTVDPGAIFFGDPVTASVIVQLDTESIAPASLHIAPSFSPFVETGPPTVVRTRTGHAETVAYTYALQCVEDGCLPGTGARAVQFRAVTATATEGNRTIKTSSSWPALLVSSRLKRVDLQASPPRFRHPSSLPVPSFGAPAWLAGLLAGVAGLLIAIAAAVFAVEFARVFRKRRGRTQRTPLELALAAVREAANHPDPADRRKALDLLARTLAAEGDERAAGSIVQVAWAEAPPSREELLALLDGLEAREEPRAA